MSETIEFPRETRGRKSTGRKKEHFDAIIATCDFETDPFKGSAYPVRPFVAGFYDGATYHEFWGDDCNVQLMRHIKALDRPHIIYAHNGGKFDFNFVLDFIHPEVFCIGTRIVRAWVIPDNDLADFDHELRDSFAAMPVALAKAAAKLEFDYDKMERGKRDRHKREISEYLKADCVELHGAMMLWREKLGGNGLTMASAAMKKLNLEMSGLLGRSKAAIKMSEKQDAHFRQFYFGGRVQTFEAGIVKPNGSSLRVYDITSSYPYVMSAYKHPVATTFVVGSELEQDTDFARIIAFSNAALPRRNEQNGKLDFPVGTFEFFATGHEIRAAQILGLIKVEKVIESYRCSERIDFDPFVQAYWTARLLARIERDKHPKGSPAWIVHDQYYLFWKLVLNGAYGKFAQNPREFKDVMICGPDDLMPPLCWCGSEHVAGCLGWKPAQISLQERQFAIYVRKLNDVAPEKTWKSYLNVATGASITGAARASLLYAIHAAKRPLYCDTDSLICEALPETEHVRHGTDLGQWKLEVEAHTAAIVGRKLYALWGERSSDEKENAKRLKDWGDETCVKLASKGVRLMAAQLLEVARGKSVKWSNQAPSFTRDGRQYWIDRKITLTPEMLRIMAEFGNPNYPGMS